MSAARANKRDGAYAPHGNPGPQLVGISLTLQSKVNLGGWAECRNVSEIPGQWGLL